MFAPGSQRVFQWPAAVPRAPAAPRWPSVVLRQEPLRRQPAVAASPPQPLAPRQLGVVPPRVRLAQILWFRSPVLRRCPWKLVSFHLASHEFTRLSSPYSLLPPPLPL